MPTFLSSIFSTILPWLLCMLLLASPLLLDLFPCAKYPVWSTHLEHGIPFPIVHTKLSLVFRTYGTSSQRLKTALSLGYNNNNVYIYHVKSTTMYTVVVILWLTSYVRRTHIVCAPYQYIVSLLRDNTSFTSLLPFFGKRRSVTFTLLVVCLKCRCTHREVKAFDVCTLRILTTYFRELTS